MQDDRSMSSQPPTGTVTFLFTDLEGSTRLLRDIGRERYEEVLSIHRRLMHEAVEGSDGYFVDKQGDGCFAVFRSGGDAVAGAAEAQRLHFKHPWPADAKLRVRMGLHT